MAEQPPAQLVAMLERLGLATAAEVAQMGRRVRRLARNLPQFESVWIDALAQARVLTPFQAAELNAGRGESLRIGPYVLCERLSHPYYVASFRARHVDSRETVRLAIVENAGPRTDAILRRLESLVGCVKRSDEFLPSPDQPSVGARRGAEGEGVEAADCRVSIAAHIPRPHPNPLPKGEGTKYPHPSPFPEGKGTVGPFITHCGVNAGRIFAASPWVDGQTAADWMIHHGRFPPEVVLEIARAMLAGLLKLEQAGICHGDVSVSSLILSPSGEVALSLPGLRAILRPEEGFSHADLVPEAYDSLAPERISAGTPPNPQSEIYACGCVWWHLLCGRPPLAGGNGLAKLRAAQAAQICDVRRHAPDVPGPLAAAISACLDREPNRRPESLARLAAMLGAPTRSGKEALADCLAQAGRPTVRWTTSVRKIRKSRRTPLWLAGTACCLAVAVAILWPIWRGTGDKLVARGTEVRGQRAVGSGQWAMGRDQQAEVRGQGSWVRGQESRIAGGESAVVRASNLAAEPSSSVVKTSYQAVEAKPQDLVLAAGKPLPAGSLDLWTGQCVRAATGQRAAVLVPRCGLIVDKENVRFENLDFVWTEAPTADDAGATEPAVVQLRAGRAEFRGCLFHCRPTQTPTRGISAPAAIRWIHPAQAEAAEISLLSGRLQLTDCMLHGVGLGVDCRTIGALAIELNNTLHLDAGPLLRLDHCPQSDEPVSIVLTQVTLRGGGPLLECVVPHAEEQPGDITVLATACAFAPEPGQPLVCFSGSTPPGRLLAGMRWTGQGSLVAPRVPIFAWREPDGQQQTIDESSLSIAGLVRSEVGFAGGASGVAAASRLVRWQAPLQSANPPGIDPAPLPAEAGMRD